MSAFVGRVAERGRLTTLLEGAAAGKGRVLFITGEAGAGKSTLIEQVRSESVERMPDLLVLHATCSEQYGAGEPYQPFVEAFRDLLVAAARDETRWGHLRELAAELAPTWISAIPLAGSLISATVTTAMELKRMGSGAPSAASEEALFFQYTEALLAAAAERPILQIIDDLHWADNASVTLLTHIARRITSERLLIVGTYRPADVDVTKHPLREAKLELERYSLAEEMALAPLDRNALRDLATSVLGGPPARDLLIWSEQRAGANPLFFQELLRWCVDQGVTLAREGEWELTRVPEAVEVPRSAEAAIERRLQRLDPETYRILEYASVQGDEFDSTMLARQLDADELALEESLEVIARTHRLVQFVETRDLPGDDISSMYRFAHSLIQDSLHNNLQGKRRILLHRKMADILQSAYGDQVDLVAQRLAVHCDEGRLPERAVQFALVGADRASRVHAHREAISLLGRALKHASTGPPRVQALRRLGDENRSIGRLVEAQWAFEEALGLANAEGDEVSAVSLDRRILTVRYQLSLPREEVESEIRRVLARAETAATHEERCHLLWMWSGMPGTSPTQAEAHCREALALADETGDASLRFNARYSLGRVLTLGTDPRSALEPLDECIRLSQGDRMREAAANNILAIVHLKLGDYREAARRFEDAADTFDSIGDPVNESLVRNNLGVLLTRLGDWDEAERMLHESLRISRRTGKLLRAMSPAENYALLAETRGDLAVALSRWQDLAEQAHEGGWWSYEVIARAGVARIHLDNADRDAAVAECARAHALLPDDDASSEASVAWHQVAARLAAADGDLPRAMSLLDRVEPTLAASDRYEWAAAQVLRAELVAATDPASARETVEEAKAILEHIGTTPLMERARSILERSA